MPAPLRFPSKVTVVPGQWRVRRTIFGKMILQVCVEYEWGTTLFYSASNPVTKSYKWRDATLSDVQELNPRVKIV